MKPKRLTDEQKIDICEKYKTGKYTCKKLAKEYQKSPTSIRSILKNRNIPINNNQSILQRKYFFNEHYFDIIDTKEKAYFLGFIYGDGYNNEKRGAVVLSVQEKDINILEKFKKEIEATNNIYIYSKWKNGENEQNTAVIHLVSRTFSDSLKVKGCPQAKSFILEFPDEEKVPKCFLRYFITGFFDANGCLSICKNGNALLNITSTEKFCKFLIEYINSEIKVNFCTSNKYPEKKSYPIRTITTSGVNQCLKLISWLYKDIDIYLDRKYNKYKELEKIVAEKKDFL